MNYVFRIMLLWLVIALTACGKNQETAGTNMHDEFLPLEKAFQFSSQQLDADTVKLSWKIADGYHLYKNKFEFSLEPDSGRIADVQMPKGTMLDDQTFGKQESYKHQVDMVIKLKAQATDQALTLTAKYQGCSEKGLCYPPEKRVINIKL